MSASEGITSWLASALRALSDEDLVLAAGPWIQDRIRSAISTSPGSREIIGRALDGAKKGRTVKVVLGAPPAAKRRAAAPAPAASRCPAAGLRDSSGDADRVFKVLAASDKPLGRAAIARGAGLGLTATWRALDRLRNERRARKSGTTGKSTVWSVAA